MAVLGKFERAQCQTKRTFKMRHGCYLPVDLPLSNRNTGTFDYQEDTGKVLDKNKYFS